MTTDCPQDQKYYLKIRQLFFIIGNPIKRKWQLLVKEKKKWQIFFSEEKREYASQKKIPFHFFLSPRCEILPQRRKHRQNVPISFISVPKILKKFAKKKKHHQNVPISLIYFSVAKMWNFCHKRKHRQNVSHFIYFCRQNFKICHKEKKLATTCLGLAMKKRADEFFVLPDFLKFSTQ